MLFFIILGSCNRYVSLLAREAAANKKKQELMHAEHHHHTCKMHAQTTVSASIAIEQLPAGRQIPDIWLRAKYSWEDGLDLSAFASVSSLLLGAI